MRAPDRAKPARTGALPSANTSNTASPATSSAEIGELACTFPEDRSRIVREHRKRSETLASSHAVASNPKCISLSPADEYYATCSSIRFVDRITTPTLCISAKDDPFLPSSVLDLLREIAPPSMKVIITERGGHIGFVAGSPARPLYWAEESAVAWVAARLA